jgi:cytochrome c oxidase subunit 2
MQIEVTGEQYWWRIIYMGEDGQPAFETANELHIPVGRPVELSLKTADVIHSFWVPGLSGKLDMIPGLTNTLPVRANEAATARGQCAEYCGAQHAQMAFAVTAAPPADYENWLARESGPAAETETGQASTGRDLFISAGCGACHAVRGTGAAGRVGPDLTHFASRRYIGAGALPNRPDNLVNWIANPDHFKPGNEMPPFAALPAEQLDAIAAYLESLK